MAFLSWIKSNCKAMCILQAAYQCYKTYTKSSQWFSLENDCAFYFSVVCFLSWAYLFFPNKIICYNKRPSMEPNNRWLKKYTYLTLIMCSRRLTRICRDDNLILFSPTRERWAWETLPPHWRGPWWLSLQGKWFQYFCQQQYCSRAVPARYSPC